MGLGSSSSANGSNDEKITSIDSKEEKEELEVKKETDPDDVEKSDWREIPCRSPSNPNEFPKREIEDFRSRIIEFERHKNVEYLNLLLLGQSASGKSSFINSCATALKNDNRVITLAGVLEETSGSATACLEAHPLKFQDGNFLRVRLFDCRGLHDIEGVHSDDIEKICAGEVVKGYEFDPKEPITSRSDKLRGNPTLSDKMHCVVYVAAADSPKHLLADKKAKEQINKIREKLTKSNIPQLVLMTKIDRLGMKDKTTIFRNTLVHEICDNARQFMSLPLERVLPMINYTGGHKQIEMIDFLALYNLWYMMTKANDYISDQLDLPEGF